MGVDYFVSSGWTAESVDFVVVVTPLSKQLLLKWQVSTRPPPSSPHLSDLVFGHGKQS